MTGDHIRFHDAIASIMRFSQCVQAGRNVSPDGLHLCPLTVDHSLVVVDKRVAFPMCGATQLATGIIRRLETCKKPIALCIRFPSDRNEPVQVSPTVPNGMAFGH